MLALVCGTILAAVAIMRPATLQRRSSRLPWR
jgi:hypothetical protein